MKKRKNCNNTYRFWLIHDRLPYDHICMLASGIIPTQLREVGYKANRAFNNCPYHTLLMSGIAVKEIRTASNGEASPLECFLYFQSKKLTLPKDLSYLLENDLEEIQANLQKAVKRSKESYLRKDTRGDDRVLEAILKTLLDLYPGYPKDRIIRLLPVQKYANGYKHSDESLKDMITKIEGGKRTSGNVSNVTEIEQKIPKKWL